MDIFSGSKIVTIAGSREQAAKIFLRGRWDYNSKGYYINRQAVWRGGGGWDYDGWHRGSPGLWTRGGPFRARQILYNTYGHTDRSCVLTLLRDYAIYFCKERAMYFN